MSPGSNGGGFHTPSNKSMPADKSSSNRKSKTIVTSRFFQITDDIDAQDYSKLLESIMSSNGKIEIIENHGSWAQDGSRTIFLVYKEIVNVKEEKK